MSAPGFGDIRSFGFFQLVHLIEELNTTGPRIGHAGPASGEHVRLRPEASFGFEAARVCALDLLREDPPQYLLTTTGFGLYGTTSPLPNFYTQKVIPEQLDVPLESRQDSPVRDFLDIINHRLLSLLYRAWLRYRLDAQYHSQDPESPLPSYLFALLGLEAEPLRQNLGVRPRRLLSFTGLFSQKPRSADSLARVLSGYFQLPVEVQQCMGRWVDISPDQCPALGSSDFKLGRTSVIGSRVFVRDQFRVVIGPTTFDRFAGLLPGEPEARELVEITSLFAQDGLAWDSKLLIRESDIKPCRPRCEQEVEAPVKLGQTTWLSFPATESGPADRVRSLVVDHQGEGRPS